MQITLYGIPNCDTVRKARAWLAENGIDYRFHDFKKAGVSAELLRAWLACMPWDALLNRRGTTWRGLPEARREAVVDADSAITLMMESASLIKRPVLAASDEVHVGFSAEQYEQLFGRICSV
ncbi:MAG: ArsC family reductase [Noviherbaspirillum sp.]